MVSRWLGVMLVVAAGSLLPPTAQADDVWLDGPLESWNEPGRGVPEAIRDPGAYDMNSPFCDRAVRPAETAEDHAVAAAGWALAGSYEGGWGIVAVTGTLGFDGMCRPMGYQVFAFVDGAFAGTLSPTPMASRTSGAGRLLAITPEGLLASFVRYANTDPLCCPSRPSVGVAYHVDASVAGPVLVPVRALSSP